MKNGPLVRQKTYKEKKKIKKKKNKGDKMVIGYNFCIGYTYCANCIYRKRKDSFIPIDWHATLYVDIVCSGHKKILACRCCLLSVKRVTCVEVGLKGMFGLRVRAKRACG